MDWTMTFNGKGKLMKATHSATSRSKGTVAERASTEVQGKPVQAVNAGGKAILIH
jgi:hypothetical protein